MKKILAFALAVLSSLPMAGVAQAAIVISDTSARSAVESRGALGIFDENMFIFTITAYLVVAICVSGYFLTKRFLDDRKRGVFRI
ncbi:MAG: hypothetical protein LBL08_01860 [Candidatus Nomurabacteria bacterium]|jgi:hypothetical protein|nr:hypothetical protein [Candidatus Nomurabacteria bacterium]